MLEPDEFDKALAQLCAGFNVPCTEERREAYGRAFRKLSPLMWDRLVDYALSEDGPDKMPTVRELWSIRRELRAQLPQAATPTQPPWEGDMWDIAANRHLLAHLVRLVVNRRRITNHAAFVEAKKAWATEMRDLAQNNGGEVPVDLQQSVWRDYIGRAQSVAVA
jgi:hypothetical protein